jgi:hypothetical protein
VPLHYWYTGVHRTVGNLRWVLRVRVVSNDCGGVDQLIGLIAIVGLLCVREGGVRHKMLILFIVGTLVSIVQSEISDGSYVRFPMTVEALTNLAVHFYDIDTSIGNRSSVEYRQYVQSIADGNINFDVSDIQSIHIMDQLSKSRTVQGASNYLYHQKFLNRLNSGKCTTILTVGGSLTCGASLEDGEEAWPNLLERFLNQMFPCVEESTSVPEVSKESQMSLNRRSVSQTGTIGRHRVENRCVSATGSSYVSRNFEYLFCDLRDRLDLVIMEFASNDLVNNDPLKVIKNDDRTLSESAPKYIEFLIRKLDSLDIPHMFLQASFRFFSDIPPHHFNAESIHLPIQRHYDVPTISFPATFLQDFLLGFEDTKSRFYNVRIMRDTNSHLTGVGHDVLTFVLLWNLQNDVSKLNLDHGEKRIYSEYQNFLELDKASWSVLNGKLLQRFDFDHSTDSSLGGANIQISNDWEHTNEGRNNKWGLVSYTPGSRVKVYLWNSEEAYAVSIGFLKSYSAMGAFRVKFLSEDESDEYLPSIEATKLHRDDNDALWNQTFKSHVVDCLWESKTSQFSPASLLIPPRTQRIVIEVMNKSAIEQLLDKKTQVKQRGQKVKLLSISIFLKRNSCMEEEASPVQVQEIRTIVNSPPALELKSVSSMFLEQPPIAFIMEGGVLLLFITVAVLLRIALRSAQRSPPRSH